MENHITPQEATELSTHIRLTDIRRAPSFAMAYFKENPFDMKDPDYSAAAVFAAIFNAGRVEGIRSERAKRRKVSNNAATGRALESIMQLFRLADEREQGIIREFSKALIEKGGVA